MGARAIIWAVALAAAFRPISAEDAADALVERAAALDRSLQAGQALLLYQQAEALEPKRREILTGIARQYRHLMADAPSDKEKARLIGQALVYSRRAVALAPDSADAHLALAITYGKRTLLESSGEKVKTSPLLKAELDRVLQLDPHNDTAWHLLGRWYGGYAELTPVRRTMGELLYGKLPVATQAQAAECLEKALAENPKRLMHYIELGRIYALMGRTDKARKLLKKGLSMPNREKDDPVYKERGNEALAGLP